MADIVQARYGWTDEYVFNELPIARLFNIFETLKEALPREQRERYKMQAFNAFLNGAAGEMDYESFLIQLGLHEDLHAEQEMSAEDAKEKAKNIMKTLG